MRISTNQLQQSALNTMLNQQTKLSKTQLEVASGRKFLTPADDPLAAVTALDLSRQLDGIDQYQRNIERASSSLITGEQTLSSVQEQLQRTRELAVQAGSSGLGADGRKAISYEARQLQQSVLALANTRGANGEYLFSGYQTQTVPYTDAGGGVFTYNGDQGQRLMEVAQSTHVAATDAGVGVFGTLSATAGGTTDVFKIIFDFATDLESNTFNPNTITDLDTALRSISDARASMGARQNTLDTIKELNGSFAVDTQKTLSSVQDLDYAEAVSRLNLQLTGLQAAQAAFVRIQNLSLFSLLR